MVRRIICGEKWQTRRLLKPQPNSGPRGEMVSLGGAWALSDGDLSGLWRCPFGVVGDALWVRETFLAVGGIDSPKCRIVYRASNDGPDEWLSPVWRPSIHMPRWASRITLEVTGVRPERIQDISPADCRAEGIEVFAGDQLIEPGHDRVTDAIYRDQFAKLWNSINAKRGHGWDANDWVWVVEFRRVN